MVLQRENIRSFLLKGELEIRSELLRVLAKPQFSGKIISSIMNSET